MTDAHLSRPEPARRGTAQPGQAQPGPAGRPVHLDHPVHVDHPVCLDHVVYLDHNATTPVDPRVAEAMLPYLTDFFGNPSSSHSYGAEPRRALAEARAQVAALIGARPAEVVFTSSGSEADLLALRGVVLASGRTRPHVITQVTEHPAVLETARALERLHGARVTVLPVDGDGWSTRPHWPLPSRRTPCWCR